MTVDNLDERVGVAMHQLPVETLAAIRRGGHMATSLIGQTADLPVPLCIAQHCDQIRYADQRSSDRRDLYQIL